MAPVLLTFGHGNTAYTKKGFYAYTKEEKIKLAEDMPCCCVTGKIIKRNMFNQIIQARTCENCLYKCHTERR
jgi:predicted methyltransferase